MEQKERQNKSSPIVNNQSTQKSTYSNFLGLLIKSGNKSKAKSILDTAFLKLSKELGVPVHIVFSKVFSKLNCFVETKKVRVRRSTYIVPFGITFKRKSYLIIKWIMESVHEDKRKLPTSEKLYFELFSILNDKVSKTISKKNLNTNQALSNRSNIHYRW